MEIIDLDLNLSNKSEYKTAIALGNFDGVHIGHKYLIEDNIQKAIEMCLKPGVLLFKNHTKNVLKENSKSVPILTSNEQKLKILKNLGVEVVFTLNFNENIMKLSGEEFVDKIIIDLLNAKLVTVGFDYRFGYKAVGDCRYLKELGIKKGFKTNIIRPITIDNEIVSSTRIRQLLMEGNIKKANKFLGRYYTILGQVIKGSNRGTKLGFPTANINPIDNYIIPKNGVYKTITVLKDQQYLSLTNIGFNPTFNEKNFKVENHILNFNNNIYGKIIEIMFMDFIREDIKFDTTEKLIEQIKKDICYVKKEITDEYIYKLINI
ncbi:riboflavin kinase/FMN adenylyltransferase [Keratinibaculum paraultunense]|uniref:Riboflavin biosynthesis protein n=1 Tax=Keratinibaculum paraultunense TaxID=1278232 RepID=A0A4R3KZZ9_9FIRM|nr:bifunctional riboflavin kinase/FAD synthetase [Keratinibaculum paraultunense]QQY80693.1 bifunctional riboflavin kinase/FAD synthetase [Keratinibaculum paraultunense]TCS89704.1 riboflavin kinase/FMN adenylyltransferase [Keratinibaculum paraultunense]